MNGTDAFLINMNIPLFIALTQNSAAIIVGTLLIFKFSLITNYGETYLCSEISLLLLWHIYSLIDND